ncbi:hypothetical protein [Algoriphagus sp.]|uniref:hypothetical protein n=1 Tax=Algoriphagus sp. TaxID=1872435 RepID=UPI002725CF0E|nr:hypothetical protein [Algoriphagus sp.]MDO8968491.1 hypothetical protein [Algoriphagus sp.]MDP3200732.1 hypothetical protein [Algoriphagus sp.]
MSSITHLITTDIYHVDGFNRFYQFFLIPENIDGAVSAVFQRFENFEEVKGELPGIIEELEFFGEWTLSLIQFPKTEINPSINVLRKKGLEIFQISYMNFNPNSKVLISNNLIHFHSEFIEGEEDWEQIDPTINFEISETYITILLEEEINEVRFPEKNYPGDVDRVYEKYYQIE